MVIFRKLVEARRGTSGAINSESQMNKDNDVLRGIVTAKTRLWVCIIRDQPNAPRPVWLADRLWPVCAGTAGARRTRH